MLHEDGITCRLEKSKSFPITLDKMFLQNLRIFAQRLFFITNNECINSQKQSNQFEECHKEMSCFCGSSKSVWQINQ